MLPQSAQCVRSDDDSDGENGIGRAVREVLGEVGCEESRVCEYRQTGHLGETRFSFKLVLAGAA